MSLTSLALGLAHAGHAGQFRRDGVTPYIVHPMRVYATLSRHSPQVQATALVHDLMEDNPAITQKVLLHAGLDPVVVAAAGYLTRKTDETYAHFIEGIISDKDGLGYTEGQRIAALVKVADIIDNSMDNPSPSVIPRYSKALRVIMRAMPDLVVLLARATRPDGTGSLLDIWDVILKHPERGTNPFLDTDKP